MEFLKEGHRLGIMASTDNHYGNPGYGYLKRAKPSSIITTLTLWLADNEAGLVLFHHLR